MNTQLSSQANDRSQLLRRVLRSNSIFSGLSGLISLVGARPLSAFMGIEAPVVFIILGAALILFAIGLFVVTAQASMDQRFGQAVVILDVLWVIGSAAILLSGWPPLTIAGKWTVALLAEVVFVFAVLEVYALRRQAANGR